MEFLRARADDRVIVDQLAEVNAWLGDVQVDGRDRRQVADEQHRQSFAGHLVDRPSVKPWPCVNTSRSLTQVRFGSAAGLSSRTDSITCRLWPLI